MAVLISAIDLAVGTYFGLEVIIISYLQPGGYKPGELVSPQANFSPRFSLLQRNDIAMAITKFDQFDFLIDIVPRDELKPPKRQVSWEGIAAAAAAAAAKHLAYGCLIMLLFLSQHKPFAISFATSLDQIHP